MPPPMPPPLPPPPAEASVGMSAAAAIAATVATANIVLRIIGSLLVLIGCVLTSVYSVARMIRLVLPRADSWPEIDHLVMAITSALGLCEPDHTAPGVFTIIA